MASCRSEGGATGLILLFVEARIDCTAGKYGNVATDGGYLSREAADPNRAERQNLIYGKREPDAHARPCDVHEYVGY